MDKLQVQQRVLQNGKPLALGKFEWDEKTNTFSSTECDLVLDFKDIHSCSFKNWSGCTFTTGSYCTFKTGSYCTFKTGSYCTFTAGSDCSFKNWSGCTFKTESYCTFTTGSGCTFTTGSGCTFKTGSDCVIVNINVFEVIQPKEGDIIQICPYNIAGHLVNGKLNGVPHIIADDILSKIISKKGNIYKVVNHRESDQSYIIERQDADKKVYSHGKTLKEARDSLVYKISDRDTSAYESMNLDTVLTKEECIVMYGAITGACEEGTRYFVESQEKVKKKYKISEIIEVTKGQFGNELLTKFFNN